MVLSYISLSPSTLQQRFQLQRLEYELLLYYIVISIHFIWIYVNLCVQSVGLDFDLEQSNDRVSLWLGEKYLPFFTFVIPVCFTNIYNFNINKTHHLLYNIFISLGYMFRLFSVIITPY